MSDKLTARIPITPEERLRKRLRTVSLLCAVLVASLLLFVVLYIYQRGVTQQNYRRVYAESIRSAATAMKDYAADSFDGKRKILTAVAGVNTAREMLFLTDEAEARQTCMNELYTACLKYPEQMAARFGAVGAALDDIDLGKEEQGYAALGELLRGLDLMGK